MKKAFLTLCLLLSAVALLYPGGKGEPQYTWPRWRGPSGNGITVEENWNLTKEPKIEWTAEVGQGFSSVTIVGQDLYTLGNHKGEDTVYCLNVKNGRVRWSFSYESQSGQYPGPRAAPLAHENRLYTFSRNGDLFCFLRESGEVIWRCNVTTQFGVPQPEWGFAGSPILVKGSLILNINRAGIALDPDTGDLLWATEESLCGYASPVVMKRDGEDLLLMFGSRGLSGVHPRSGDILWFFEWRTAYDANAADPLVIGDRVFISSNYRRGCALIQVRSDGYDLLWENSLVNSHFSSFVHVQGYIYANDGDANAHFGTFRCLRVDTGEETWSAPLGFGSLIVAGGRLLLVTERRDIVEAELAHDEYREIARMKLPRGLIWTPPVLVNGRLYIRSMNGTLYAIRV